MKKTYIAPLCDSVSYTLEGTILTGSIIKGEGSLGSEGEILSNRFDNDIDWDEE